MAIATRISLAMMLVSSLRHLGCCLGCAAPRQAVHGGARTFPGAWWSSRGLGNSEISAVSRPSRAVARSFEPAHPQRLKYNLGCFAPPTVAMAAGSLILHLSAAPIAPMSIHFDF